MCHSETSIIRLHLFVSAAKVVPAKAAAKAASSSSEDSSESEEEEKVPAKVGRIN